MTIKVIYKVEGDCNEYDSKQEAQIAEVLETNDSIYIEARTRLNVAKAICSKYLLCPIPPTTTVQEPRGEQKDSMTEVNSWGASA